MIKMIFFSSVLKSKHKHCIDTVCVYDGLVLLDNLVLKITYKV